MFFIKMNRDIIASLTTGVISAIAFNPIDRALYLSVTEKRPFLRRVNFMNPYCGFGQAAFHRIIGSGIYFFYQSQITKLINNEGKSIDTKTNILIGCIAGSLNGITIHQLASVKYHCWNNNGYTMYTTMKKMWNDKGIKSFTKGSLATINRDTLFGIVYEGLRIDIQQYIINFKEGESLTTNEKLISNVLSGCIATIVSSPFNYIRNIKFSTPNTEQIPSGLRILKDLYHQCKLEKHKIRFINQKMGIGWGTFRVGLGMGIGQLLFGAITSCLPK